MRRRDGAADFVCSFEEEKRETAAISVPQEMLPADFDFVAGSDGMVEMTITSLANSRKRSMTARSGFFTAATNGIVRTMRLASGGGMSEAVIDNLSVAIDDAGGSARREPPWTARPERTFDPVAAGWPLVFSDEFDGSAVDTNKWDIAGDAESRECAALSGDGRLLIKADYRKDSADRLRTTGLWSVKKFRYGYFEARVKFTRESGWWATTRAETAVRLPAGRHTLALFLFGQFNFTDFELEKVK